MRQCGRALGPTPLSAMSTVRRSAAPASAAGPSASAAAAQTSQPGQASRRAASGSPKYARSTAWRRCDLFRWRRHQFVQFTTFFHWRAGSGWGPARCGVWGRGVC